MDSDDQQARLSCPVRIRFWPWASERERSQVGTWGLHTQYGVLWYVPSLKERSRSHMQNPVLRYGLRVDKLHLALWGTLASWVGT